MWRDEVEIGAQRHRDLAASLQQVYEERFFALSETQQVYEIVHIAYLEDGTAVPPAEEQRPMLESIARNGQRLILLCDDLLTLSGLDSGATAWQHDTLDLAKKLLRAYHRDRVGAETAGTGIDSEDVLEVFKAFVKGDPSLNAVRDNLREIVYYRNCIDMKREDALPPKPANMAVRTARHVYLYLRTRALKEHRLDAE